MVLGPAAAAASPTLLCYRSVSPQLSHAEIRSVAVPRPSQPRVDMARGTFPSQSGLEVGRSFQVKRLGRLPLGVIATPDDPSDLWEGGGESLSTFKGCDFQSLPAQPPRWRVSATGV